MVENVTKLQVKKDEKSREGGSSLQVWRPFEGLRKEMDRLLEQFETGWRSPFRRSLFDVEPLFQREFSWTSPAVDIVEKDKSYEVTAELPGMEEKNIEVAISNGTLTIKGEKSEEKEEKKTESDSRQGHGRTILPSDQDFGAYQASTAGWFAIPRATAFNRA